MKDSYKGVTRGRQLTYFGDDDRLLVDGMEKLFGLPRGDLDLVIGGLLWTLRRRNGLGWLLGSSRSLRRRKRLVLRFRRNGNERGAQHDPQNQAQNPVEMRFGFIHYS